MFSYILSYFLVLYNPVTKYSETLTEMLSPAEEKSKKKTTTKNINSVHFFKNEM